MHTIVMGTRGVDHVNGNGLDNRRENLRSASPAQNAANVLKRRGNPSPYKGVYARRRARDRVSWVAQIRIGGRLRYLGRFDDAAAAAHAYDFAARAAYGAFACVNFPAAGERGAVTTP